VRLLCKYITLRYIAQQNIALFYPDPLHFFILNAKSTVKQRIKALVEYLGVNQTEIAKQSNLHPSHLSQAGSENRPTISKDIVLNITNRYPEINPWWLFTGVGEMLLSKEREKISKDRVEEESMRYGGGPLAALREKVLDHEETIRLLREIQGEGLHPHG